MRVLKFGGTSVGNAERIVGVAKIIVDAARSDRVGVVVSAVAGVTNLLVDSTNGVLDRRPAEEFVDQFQSIHLQILAELIASGDDAALQAARDEVLTLCSDYKDLLHGVSLLQECSASVLDHVSSLGERASVAILQGLLLRMGAEPVRLDAREVIITNDRHNSAMPVYEEIDRRFAPFREGGPGLMLMGGFFGATPAGKTTTLGRGGSDFSGSMMAAALHADVLEIWTDVDGVYSADPSVVPEAFLLESCSYEEAMELSFFGAKVLHPRTLAPLLARRIPIYIRNSFRPELHGTLIHTPAAQSKFVIRGISALSGVVMIAISGAGMRGSFGVAARVFQTMAREGISVILISQASSEYSIAFCVAREAGARAASALEQEFELERSAGQVNPLDVQSDLAILSIVGDDMRFRRGIAGTFFGALASADVNVVAIAQGSSERNISVVIEETDRIRAVRAAHQFFFNTQQQVQVFIAGVGHVGSELIEQIRLQRPQLLEQHVELRGCGVANSSRMLVDLRGIDLSSWRQQLAAAPRPFNLEEFNAIVRDARLLDPVFVDCTSSTELAGSYLDVFLAGMHIVTANKKANSFDQNYYGALRRVANSRRRKFLYETNVGAGLPVIDTLRNLVHSGDHLVEFQGILSGSLSYLFGRLEDGALFSEALAEARQKGFTEPDPREDLTGLDVARKLLILAREVGYRLELSEVQVHPVLPEGFDSSGSTQEFMARVHQVDSWFQDRIGQQKRQGKVLRYVANIGEGRCSVGLAEVGQENPLHHVRGGENAVSFLTDRYRPIPLVVRGYGAGPAVTAAGVFANILQTVYFNPEGPA